jgi:hypothetical protein
VKPRRDKGRLAPFVPLLKETMATPAWRAMSPNARMLYIALKQRYSTNLKNNGRLYLSARVAANEVGLGKNIMARCFRELQHYGFIVQTAGGCLGVDGKGKAPRWRLPELGYMTDPPTRDFMRWNGELFHEQKSPEHYKRQERRLANLAAARLAKKTEPRTDVRDTPYRRQGH